VNADGDQRKFGLQRGKVFPAEEARSLLNPLRRLVQSPNRTVAVMRLPSDARVLEIGPGPGFFSPVIARTVEGGALVLMDVQLEMTQLARGRLTGHTNVTYVQGDAAALPFRSGQFDAVFLATMLGEVPDRDGCLGQVHRVLRRGGVLTVAETRRDSDFIPMMELRELLERHGFSLMDRHGIRWQYTARFRAV
jgi:ubiquinone/menaquinone biosynthesis C-methylase UbiE